MMPLKSGTRKLKRRGKTCSIFDKLITTHRLVVSLLTTNLVPVKYNQGYDIVL